MKPDIPSATGCIRLAGELQSSEDRNKQPSRRISESASKGRQPASGRSKRFCATKGFRCGRFGRMAASRFDGHRLDREDGQPRCRKRCNTAVPPASNKWTACPADDVSRFVRFIYGHQRRGDGQFGAQSSVHLNCPAIPVWDSNANREMPKIVQKLATPAHVPPACLSARTIQITAVLHPIALHGLIDTRASLWFMHFSLWQHIAEI